MLWCISVPLPFSCRTFLLIFTDVVLIKSCHTEKACLQTEELPRRPRKCLSFSFLHFTFICETRFTNFASHRIGYVYFRLFIFSFILSFLSSVDALNRCVKTSRWQRDVLSAPSSVDSKHWMQFLLILSESNLIYPLLLSENKTEVKQMYWCRKCMKKVYNLSIKHFFPLSVLFNS